MRLSLTQHPDMPAAGLALEVQVVRAPGGTFALTYQLGGPLARLALPEPAAPGRADELWKHTCFEAFVRPASGEAYCEFNLAPSGRWAAYRLSGYRRDLTAIAPFNDPGIAVDVSEDRLVLSATLDLSALPELAADAPWTLGLTAVIEARDGSKSYWALKHGPGAPDFHHPDCFALELPAPQRS